MDKFKEGITYRFNSYPFEFLFKCTCIFSETRAKVIVIKNLNDHSLSKEFELDLGKFRNDIFTYKNLNGD